VHNRENKPPTCQINVDKPVDNVDKPVYSLGKISNNRTTAPFLAHVKKKQKTLAFYFFFLYHK
jgi:hypothetical protein